ncbi:MAG: hypothetical protein E7Z69_08395 [Thermoplasmata archaeon]|nr:hypothetical protein [Thermoplasmata archaeon]
MNGTKRILLAVLMLTLVAVCCPSLAADGAQSDISIDGVQFDPDEGTLSFRGSAGDDLIKLYVEDGLGTRVTPYHSYPVRDGSFQGIMDVSYLDSGDYVLVAFQNAEAGGVRTARVTISLHSDHVPATGLVLSAESLTITAASATVITATVLPEGSDDRVTWSSSNTRFVEVDQNGRLTPKLYTSGQYVEVIATAGGVSAVCMVKVDYAPAAMTPDRTTIAQDSSRTLTVEVPPGMEGRPVVWRSSSGHVTVDGSGPTAKVKGAYVGETTVTAVVGGLYIATCEVTVSEKPVVYSTYTFYLRIVSAADAQRASYGKSGLTAADMLSGITLTGTGPNAGAALESCLKANNITCSFWSGGEIKYWVDQILGLKQVQYSNGDWKYWIQYKDGRYNDWTLGWYTDGGSFSLIYGITSEHGQMVDPDIHGDDDPSNTTIVVNPDNSTTTTTTVTNPDGSTVVIVETVKTSRGSAGSTIHRSDKEATFRDADGNLLGVVRTETETVTSRDRSVSVSSTETALDPNGNILSVTVRSEERDRDGNVVLASEVLRDADGSDVSWWTEESGPGRTYTDADGNEVTESSTTRTEGDSSGRTSVTSKTVRSWVRDGGTVSVRDIVTETVGPDGEVTRVTTRETVEDRGSGILRIAKTETVGPDGVAKLSISAQAGSKDGSARTLAEFGPDGISLATVVPMADASMGISRELAETIRSQRDGIAGRFPGEPLEALTLRFESPGYGFSLSFGDGAVGPLADSAVTVISGSGSISFDASVLRNLGGEGGFAISLWPVDRSELSEAQRGVLAPDSTLIAIAAMSGDADLGDRLGGTVTVTVSHQPTEGLEPVAYHIGDDGTKTEVPQQGYDRLAETFWMELSHFSVYEIADESPQSEDSGKGIPAMYIYAAAVLAVSLSACLFYVLRRV